MKSAGEEAQAHVGVRKFYESSAVTGESDGEEEVVARRNPAMPVHQRAGANDFMAGDCLNSKLQFWMQVWPAPVMMPHLGKSDRAVWRVAYGGGEIAGDYGSSEDAHATTAAPCRGQGEGGGG